MARGKITEYQQGSFSKQAVGTPGMDQSGAIIGKGLEELGNALIKRQEASDNLTAMDKFGEFEFKSTQKKFELQRQYQNDPMKYVTAAKEESMKLADEFTKGMPGGAAKKFKQLSMSSIAQDMEGNAKWAFARDNEIQVGKITSIKQNIALKASAAASPQDLLAIKGDFEAVAPEAQKFITKEDDDKLTKTHWELAKKYAMKAQMQNSPYKLKADLDGHAYDGVLDPDEIKQYSDEAGNAIKTRDEDEVYRTLHAAEGKIHDFVSGLDDGSVNIVDLIAEREANYANLGKIKDPRGKATALAYVGNLDALIASKTRAIARTDIGKKAKEDALGKFTRDWDAYLSEKSKGGVRPSPEDLTKELKLLEGLQDAHNKGFIDRNDLYEKMAIMSTKYRLSKSDIGGAMPFEQAINEAGAVSGWYGFRKGTDVISTGYREIKDWIDKSYPELLPEERTMLKAQALIQYHQVIKDIPKEQLDSAKTDRQREALARGILLGGANAAGNPVRGLLQKMAFFKDGAGKTYNVGDTRKDRFGNEQLFSGKDSTGNPVWKWQPGAVIKNGSGGRAIVGADGVTLETL